MKRLIPIFLILSLSLIGCSAPNTYEGKHVDLNTIAMNSIVGLYDYTAFNRIVVVEEDDYGRRMFAFWGGSVAADYQLYGDLNYVFSIIISQKTDDGYVYYYPDYNFVLQKSPWDQRPSEEQMIRYTQENLVADYVDQLKENNDWNKPFNEHRCTRIRVTQVNRDMESTYGLVSAKNREKASATVFPGEGFVSNSFFYLTSDDYNRHIYFFRATQADALDEEKLNDPQYVKSFFVVFNKDGSFDPVNGIMEVEDSLNYQNKLKTFKEKNNWNKPLK